MRGIVIAAFLSVAACTCFRPVYEQLDGGSGGGAGGGAGGSGGGAGGGSASGCLQAADCSRAGPATSLCPFLQRDAGFSCIDFACVYECTPGRSCSTAFDAGCLGCGGFSRSCEASFGCGTTMAAAVEADNGCPSSLAADLMLMPLPGGCGWTVVDSATGRELGTVYRLEDGTFLAHLPDLGGTCVGLSAATQVERWLLSCPACQFEVRL